MAGYEGGIDIRRDDGTLDASIELIGRNGEVHLTVSVDGAAFGYARVGLDLTSVEAHELVGALKDAVRAAGSSEPVSPRSVRIANPNVDGDPAGGQWSVPDDQASMPLGKWTAQDVGHVLGERD